MARCTTSQLACSVAGIFVMLLFGTRTGQDSSVTMNWVQQCPIGVVTKYPLRTKWSTTREPARSMWSSLSRLGVECKRFASASSARQSPVQPRRDLPKQNPNHTPSERTGNNGLTRGARIRDYRGRGRGPPSRREPLDAGRGGLCM